MSRIKWFRNTAQWVLLVIVVIILLALIVYSIQSMGYSRTGFDKALEIAMLSIIIICLVAILLIFFFKYPVRFGISNEGIHLKFLGHMEIMHWQTIKSIERVKGDPVSVVIKKHSNAIQPIGMVRTKILRQMNEAMKRHKA